MDPLAYDLYIQDFVTSNILLHRHVPWETLVSRLFVEDGKRKVFQFQRGESVEYAVAELIVLPDAEWLRITLPGLPVSDMPVETLRFDCLRMTYQNTHSTMNIVRTDDTILVRIMTKHRGLINVVFVIRNNVAQGTQNPCLL
jgi:hypothetical protein